MDMLPDLWRQEYWLPAGVTWQDMERLPDSERPRPRNLLMALPLALGFVALRLLFERYVVPPLGRCVGLKSRLRATAAPSVPLELFYTKISCQPQQSDVVRLMSQSAKTRRQVELWFHLRRNQDRPCHAKKFAEASWRFFFYLIAFLAGLACVINTPWFWDHRECWRHYPLQRMEVAHYWYYMLELGFYTSLLLRISVDIKRKERSDSGFRLNGKEERNFESVLENLYSEKDFKEQVIHHFATIFLLVFSYCANYIRVGTLVLVLHDSSDILLELAKMLNYGTGWRKTCDSLFIVFAMVFIVTRLVIFPSKIIRTTFVLSMEEHEPFFGYYFFNVMLMVLQVLHIFWAFLIVRMAVKFLFLRGKLDKDARSDEESDPAEEEEEEKEEGGEYCWERSTSTLNSKLSLLTNSCVLNNLTHRRPADKTQ